MKYKLISLILVSVLLISLNSCGGEMPTHESTVPSIPETPAATPSPETPAEQEPISLEFDALYADLTRYPVGDPSGSVSVVSSLAQYSLMCLSLENPEEAAYRYSEEFFEDHYLLFCCFECGVSQYFGISDVTITNGGDLTIHVDVVSPQMQSFGMDKFVYVISIPKEIKITNFDDICVNKNNIDMTDGEFKEFMESLKNKTQEVQNEN